MGHGNGVLVFERHPCILNHTEADIF